MKAVTLGQPHATLVALGAQTIVTTKHPTDHRGPLAIHAAKSVDGIVHLSTDVEAGWQFGRIGDWTAYYCFQTSSEGTRGHTRMSTDRGFRGVYLPLGAVVATARLLDVVPIVSSRNEQVGGPMLDVLDNGHLLLWRSGVDCADISDQLPYADFTPGRWAWLLDDVKATEQRCPACRRTAGDYPSLSCPTCDGGGSCPPIPAKGHPGLWEFTP